MSFKVDWQGEAFKRNVRGGVEKAVTGSAKACLEEAKTQCPVEKVGRDAKGWKKRVPGSLRDSGRVTSFQKDGVIGAYVTFGGRGHKVNGVDTYYAPFVELGTPGTVTVHGRHRISIKSKPFLRRSFRKKKSKLLKEIQALL